MTAFTTKTSQKYLGLVHGNVASVGGGLIGVGSAGDGIGLTGWGITVMALIGSA